MPINIKMKKIILFLTTLTILTFTSCEFIDITNNEPDTSIYAPTITSATEGLVIAPTIVTGTEYMNIFRYEISAESAIVENSTKNIGQINPADSYSGPVQFIDYYCEASKSYQYYIRYKTSHTYRYSEASKTFVLKTGSGEKAITSSEESVPVTFNKNQCILSFNSTLIDAIPTSYDTTKSFNLMIGLNNSVSTYVFPMTLDSDNVYRVSLRNVIPSDFFDVDLELKCLIGRTEDSIVKGTDDTTEIYKVFHFTFPLTTLSTTDGTNALDSFQVPTQVTSTDYSDLTDTTN